MIWLVILSAEFLDFLIDFRPLPGPPAGPRLCMYSCTNPLWPDGVLRCEVAPLSFALQ